MILAEYAYFFFYSLVRGAYIKRRTVPGGKAPTLSTAAELLVGAVAGALAQIFTIPVSVIATRQQVGSTKRRVGKKVVSPAPDEIAIGVENGDEGNREGTASVEKWIEEEEYVDDSFWGVGREIVREEGVTGLWLGIKPGLVLTVNPAITYGVFERIKSVLLLAQEKAASVALRSNGKLTPGMSFLVGALSKTLATVVTYPYIMAKVRIQARGSDAQIAKEEGLPAPPHHGHHHIANSKHPGALDLLRIVYRREGFAGWYQVGFCHFKRLKIIRTDPGLFIGNGRADNQGRPLSGTFVHVQGTVRTLVVGYNGYPLCGEKQVGLGSQDSAFPPLPLFCWLCKWRALYSFAFLVATTCVYMHARTEL